MRKRSPFIAYPLLTGMLLLGCSVGPKYEPPSSNMPCEWHSKISPELQQDSIDNFIWWESLNDPMLTSLIERASQQNLDLSIALLRIAEARAQVRGGKAALYPHLDATASAGHLRYNKHTVNQILGTHAKRDNLDFFEAGFDAEWEIDLFGKSTHDILALKVNAEAIEMEYSHIWISLSAEVARHYIELRGFQMQLETLNHEIAVQNDFVKLSKDLANFGFTSSVDAEQASTQLNLLLAQKPDIEFRIQKSIHALSILLGYSPGDLFCELLTPAPLPILPCHQPIGVPSELLRRRPDIGKAERELAAATESVGSAVASLFPRLSLRGFIGELGAFGPGSYTWLAGPQLLFPIFNSRSLQQDVKINKIKAQQALYHYHKTVLSALEEAENSIAAFHSEFEKNNHLKNAVHASESVYTQTLDLYKKGFKSYLEVALASRTHYDAKVAQLQSETALLLDYIALYKSLGGNWRVN